MRERVELKQLFNWTFVKRGEGEGEKEAKLVAREREREEKDEEKVLCSPSLICPNSSHL
jgi:hypothetical protein